jgi:rhamnulokinase
MQQIVQPGTIIGDTSPEVTKSSGLKNTPVAAVASHDTGSAIVAVPASDDDFSYISCGTWSLMGILSREPIINEETFKYNITNEGGIYHTFRVLKNITGLWLLQQCRLEWAKTREYSYDELVNMARTSADCNSIIDQDRPEFFNPPNMLTAINNFCQETRQAIPQDIGQYVRIILRSLALAHRYTLELLKDACNRNIKRLHIIGGGAQNQLLCQLTADATGLPVYAGPVEATAIGNILVQAMASGKTSSLQQIRDIAINSSSTQLYEPEQTDDWDSLYQRFVQLKQPG